MLDNELTSCFSSWVTEDADVTRWESNGMLQPMALYIEIHFLSFYPLIYRLVSANKVWCCVWIKIDPFHEVLTAPAGFMVFFHDYFLGDLIYHRTSHFMGRLYCSWLFDRSSTVIWVRFIRYWVKISK